MILVQFWALGFITAVGYHNLGQSKSIWGPKATVGSWTPSLDSPSNPQSHTQSTRMSLLHKTLLLYYCSLLFAEDLDEWMNESAVREIVCILSSMQKGTDINDMNFNAEVLAQHSKSPSTQTHNSALTSHYSGLLKPASNAKPRNPSVCYTCCAQKTLKYWFVEWIVLLYIPAASRDVQDKHHLARAHAFPRLLWISNPRMPKWAHAVN